MILKEYSSLAAKRFTNRNYAQRQKDLVSSITSNPKPVYQPINSYRGHEMSLYKTGKERTMIRDFLFNKDLKLNWKTIELVNIDERNLEEKPLTELSERCKKAGKNIHWLGKFDDNGTYKHFLVSEDMIPEDYANDPGPLFKPKFFENLRYNVEKTIPKSLREKFKKAFDTYSKSAITDIKMSINENTKEKEWLGKTVDGTIVPRDDMDEKWLKENFQQFYPKFYTKITTIRDRWFSVPTGSRDGKTGNLLKIEETSYISIYAPNSHKCAFANLANALYAIPDFEAAKFFEDKMDYDNEQLDALLKKDRRKVDMTSFIIATRLLQEHFGYQLKKIQIYDDLLKPVPLGNIKYVTLMPSANGYKHVIAIVGNKIYDCENQKVLKLCKENIAWCGSQPVDVLNSNRQTIIIGYMLEVSKARRVKKRIQFKQHHKKSPDDQQNLKGNISDKEGNDPDPNKKKMNLKDDSLY